MISFLNKYLGWRNWAVIRYNSIFENLFVILYIAFRQRDFSSDYLLDVLLFLLFSVLSTTYGYLINDYADMELDKAHGKSNTFQDDSTARAFLISMLFLVLSIFSGLPFANNPAFALLWLLWIILSTFYSLPPVRLKERGTVGIVLVVLAQRVIPIFLVFAAFNFTAYWELSLLALYVLARGASSDINHQLKDLENDIKTGTKTFAVSAGHGKTQKALSIVLFLEQILLASLLIFFVIKLTYLDLLPKLLLWVTALLYFFMLFRSFPQSKSLPPEGRNPFRPNASNIYQFLHHSYPSVILAAGFNVMLLYYNWHYTLLFAGLAALRGLFNPVTIRNSFVYKEIKRLLP